VKINIQKFMYYTVFADLKPEFVGHSLPNALGQFGRMPLLPLGQHLQPFALSFQLLLDLLLRNLIFGQFAVFAEIYANSLSQFHFEQIPGTLTEQIRICPSSCTARSRGSPRGQCLFGRVPVKIVQWNGNIPHEG
jgi:hypothetical protein